MRYRCWECGSYLEAETANPEHELMFIKPCKECEEKVYFEGVDVGMKAQQSFEE
jgi:DNA-directed RNA polymerase subunit RPC12/RpoP